MPMETQGKIVRALQDQTFERLGGAARVKVDVRVLATTNRDLQAEIAAGRFREDLYYRLAVVPLRLPSLRERREDIPDLARLFLARSAETAGLPVRELSADALAALQSYEWPGNVARAAQPDGLAADHGARRLANRSAPRCCRRRSGRARRRC